MIDYLGELIGPFKMETSFLKYGDTSALASC
jgi:hypothetical protein